VAQTEICVEQSTETAAWAGLDLPSTTAVGAAQRKVLRRGPEARPLHLALDPSAIAAGADALQTVERTLAATRDELQAEGAQHSVEEREWRLTQTETGAEVARLEQEVRRLQSGAEQDLAARERLLERNEVKQFAEAVKFQAEVCRTALFCCVAADLLMVAHRSRRLRCFGLNSSSRSSALVELKPRCGVLGVVLFTLLCVLCVCVVWWCV
jgi:hypothetical protein